MTWHPTNTEAALSLVALIVGGCLMIWACLRPRKKHLPAYSPVIRDLIAGLITLDEAKAQMRAPLWFDSLDGRGEVKYDDFVAANPGMDKYLSPVQVAEFLKNVKANTYEFKTGKLAPPPPPPNRMGNRSVPLPAMRGIYKPIGEVGVSEPPRGPSGKYQTLK